LESAVTRLFVRRGVARETEVVVRNSTAFEQQVHRIHELIEGSGVEVTWDDHIPDPDNPAQLRQIDITIRRDGKLTFVECRDHRSRQDVLWIEELIGRRASLKADAIIAVSSSGFTAGALAKATGYGIIARDLRALTGLEIQDWGKQVALTLYFYQYSDLELSLCFKRESVARLDIEDVRSEIASYTGIQSLFNAAAQQLGTLNLVNAENAGREVSFGLRLQLDGFQLSGESVLEVDFRGKVALTSKEISSPVVSAYGNPKSAPMQREATIEQFSLGGTSILHAADRISVFLDVSQLEVPPLCQFRFFRLAGHDDVCHEAIELVGLERLWVKGGKMKVNLFSNVASDCRGLSAKQSA
jgi:Restriction endonuclease